MSKQTVSIIICTMNRPVSLRRTIASIFEQTRLPERIVIVDASGDLHSREVVRELQGREVAVEYFQTNPGLTFQRNFGIDKAGGDIVGFFDDDVVLDKNYLETIMTVFESDTESKVGGATGYIYNKINTLKGIRKWFNKIRSSISGPKYLAKHYRMPLMPTTAFDYTMPIRYVSGCNMFFRKDVFLKYRFDECFKGYGLGEDREFGLRVSRDWTILAVGKARLNHCVEPAGRPNYQKLGRMTIENPCRIVSIARDDKITWHCFCVIFGQFIGLGLTSFGWLLRGRCRESLDLLFGGLKGIFSSFIWIINRNLYAQMRFLYRNK